MSGKTNDDRGTTGEVGAGSSAPAEPPAPPAAPAEPPAPPGGDNGDGDKNPSKTIQVAAWTYFALLIAVLAAIGIQGDVLTRQIRNDPKLFATAVIITLVGGALTAVVLMFARSKVTYTLVGAGVVLSLVGVCMAVWSGTDMIARREPPALAFSVSRLDPNVVHVKADADAISLQAHETLLLRVALFGDPSLDDADTLPRDPWYWCANSDRWILNDLSAAPEMKARIVAWSFTGTDSTGEADLTWESDLNIEGVRYVCAYAAVTARTTNQPTPTSAAAVKSAPVKPTNEKDRSAVVSIVDVTDLVKPPTDTETADPAADPGELVESDDGPAEMPTD